MKKLATWLTILMLCLSTTLVSAQSTQQKSKPSTHLKKDGTPDKRYKENKTTPTHLKKDGTPDKRYKENKKTKM